MTVILVKVLCLVAMVRCVTSRFSTAIDASNIFAMRLFSAMPDSSTTSNRFFSPASINVALAKTLLGSSGETKMQLEKALNWTYSNKSEMHYMLHEFITILGRRVLTKNKLTIASRMFLQENITLRKEFVDAVADLYLSRIGRVDFENSEEARKKINLWVERGTDKTIKRLVDNDIVSSKTRLIIVDGFDYRGVWRTRFDQSKTYTGDFHLTKKKISKLKMMKTYGQFFWRNCSALHSNVLDLPYSGETISMVVILPHNIQGLEKVEEKFSYENYKDCFSGMMQEAVEVHFPRFRLREEYDMEKPLSKIGLENIFKQDEADFSGMTGKKGLYVNHFIHQANMRMQERGTEAPLLTPDRVDRFIVDHPFLFTIQDKISGAILLIGKVQKPKHPSSMKTETVQSQKKLPKSQVGNVKREKGQPNKDDDSK